MTEVGVLEARNNLSGLIKKALAGEEIVITSRQVPQVRLVPVSPALPIGSGAAILAALSSLPLYQGDPADMEARIRQERESWD
ncbi:MAG: type II toxin-antitoxin system prevent-host-death family antitoxin [Propionibacteriaceae bacterium]|jgi:prevent-host-death family protein|nr:type II toxin-antitoxin system prevent-host-death family antitoxin [Propionibacteriaceae bacterium]